MIFEVSKSEKQLCGSHDSFYDLYTITRSSDSTSERAYYISLISECNPAVMQIWILSR